MKKLIFPVILLSAMYACECEDVTPEVLAPPQFAELSIDSLVILGVSCVNGCQTTAVVHILNTGELTAENFVVQFTFDPQASMIVRDTIAELAAQDDIWLEVNSGVGGNCYDPDCTICVIVDAGEDVPEDDEENNKSCITYVG